MTFKTAKRLSVTQASKVIPRNVRMLFRMKQMNPRLVREIMQVTQNGTTFADMWSLFLQKKLNEGDVRAFRFAKNLLDSKINQNEKSRKFALNQLSQMAELNPKTDRVLIQLLKVGIKDPLEENRMAATFTLRLLAEKGKKSTLPLFKVLAKDKNEQIREAAIVGGIVRFAWKDENILKELKTHLSDPSRYISERVRGFVSAIESSKRRKK